MQFKQRSRCRGGWKEIDYFYMMQYNQFIKQQEANACDLQKWRKQ